jgi:hypothetical protein
MRIYLLRGLATGAIVLLTGACASASGAGGELAETTRPTTTVEVVNHNWQDITVYAVRPGSRVRLGTVTSLTKETFSLPRSVVATNGTVQLLAAPVGSTQTYRSDPILVNPGDRVEWTLQNQLPLSSYRVVAGQRRW